MLWAGTKWANIFPAVFQSGLRVSYKLLPGISQPLSSTGHGKLHPLAPGVFKTDAVVQTPLDYQTIICGLRKYFELSWVECEGEAVKPEKTRNGAKGSGKGMRGSFAEWAYERQENTYL